MSVRTSPPLARRAFLGLALGACLAPRDAAAAPTLDETLDAMAKARAKLRTLRATFVQVRSIGLLATEVTSNGRLTLRMPDRLRWDLLPPEDVTYWVGPEGLAMRNKEGVTRIGKSGAAKFAAVLGDLRVMLGGDLRELQKRYDLSVAAVNDAIRITARPRDAQVKKHIQALALDTNPTKALVKRVVITEKNGDSSTIDFDHFVLNEPVADAEVTPPSK
ncbi:MAG: outer membrane lipoprotein carrier protein LolA [Polyangiaceae bacterium]